MVRKKKYPGNTPTTTSERWTGVRDPRATTRFALDERVAWDEGDRIILAVVIDFLDDECAIRVRLENGSTAIWPTVSARLRRVQTPDYDSVSVATQVEPPPVVARFGDLIPVDEPLPTIVADFEGEEHNEDDTIDVNAATQFLKRRDP